MLANYLFQNNRAFSLAEAVIAAVIFAVAVAGVVTSIQVFQQPVRDAEIEVGAAVFRKQVMERLRNEVAPDGLLYSSFTDYYFMEDATGTYTACLDNNADLGYPQLDVGIYWEDPIPCVP